MHDTTTSQDIIEKVEQVLHEYDFYLSILVCLSTDGEANMVGIMVLSPSYEKKYRISSGFAIYTFILHYS